MKNLKLLALAAIGCLSFASCSDDDDSNADNYPRLYGTYDLVAWNGPVQVNLNGDAVSSYNIADESDCYGGSTLVINEDGTYTMTYRFLSIDENGDFTCDAESSAGTWVRNSNTVTTTSADNVTTNYAFTVEEHRVILTRDLTNTNYPMLTAQGDAAFGIGDVRIVFRNQD